MLKNISWLGASLVIITFSGAADAGQITNLQLADGTSNSPTVTISYTEADGNGHLSAVTYADPQVSGGTTAPIYYCIDLWHDNYFGSTYTITPSSSIAYEQTSTFSDVDNRLAWLVNQPQATVDERGAVQLAMWYTTDNKGFSFAGGDDTLRSGYNTLIDFAGYDPTVHYAAQFWAATHDPGNTLNQDLISAVAGTAFTTNAVPEPSGLLLAGVGLAAAAGSHVLRRRRRASVS